MVLLKLKIPLYVQFFFSSRRRHTRFSRDWSSDVCSSDLERVEQADDAEADHDVGEPRAGEGHAAQHLVRGVHVALWDRLTIPDRCAHPAPGPFHLAHAHHRSEEHTSELQSRENLVCRLLL